MLAQLYVSLNNLKHLQVHFRLCKTCLSNGLNLLTIRLYTLKKATVETRNSRRKGLYSLYQQTLAI